MAWSSLFKFFLAGRGLSFRTGKYIAQALLVGAFVGLTVVVFHLMIEWGARYVFARIVAAPASWSWRGVLRFVLPALGALLGYFIIRRFASQEHMRGTDSAILAFHRRHGYVPPTVLPAKSVASVLTVSSGGSAGYEGPVTLLGAACGSIVASWFGLSRKARRILMTAGISAGIAALFKAPLAGAIFGFEILYSSSDVEYDCILPCFVASVVSYSIFGFCDGWDALFQMRGISYENGLRLLPYLVLALVIVFAARLYITVFKTSERLFSRVKGGTGVRVVVGGLLTASIGLVVPQVLGTSYSVIRDVLQTGSIGVWMLLAIFFAKVVATSCTVGSGGSGGVFAPAIVCGGALGAAVGRGFAQILPASWGIYPEAFALVGMAGFLASAIRVPMTAVVMVAEIADNHHLIVPAMWVCGIAFWLNNGWSLYRSQPHSRESSQVHTTFV